MNVIPEAQKKRKNRHELKHVINLMDYYSLSSRVRAICKPDKNAGNDSRYHIRSIYFDNMEDIALREKLDGLPNRDKYRIRIYNLSDQRILLEKKSKVGGLCVKKSSKLTRKQCDAILSGNLSWILDTEDSVLIDFYAKVYSKRLKPRTVVDYYREAYTYPHGNVRITFDSDIRTGLYSKDLFAVDLPTIPISNDRTMVLEVKYDEFLPSHIRSIIQLGGRKSQEFSKYARSRMYC